jgi:transposase
MTDRTRWNHSGSFKVKVALDVLLDRKVLLEMAEKYRMDPTQVTKWKKQLFERACVLIWEMTLCFNSASNIIRTLF